METKRKFYIRARLFDQLGNEHGQKWMKSADEDMRTCLPTDKIAPAYRQAGRTPDSYRDKKQINTHI